MIGDDTQIKPMAPTASLGLGTIFDAPTSGPNNPALGGIGAADIVTKLGDGNRLLGQLITAIQNLSPKTTGSFTLDAAASTVVTNAYVTAASFIVLTPTSASAGTLQGSAKCLFVTAADGSFTVTTASGGSAAGTETFAYAAFTTL